MDIVWSSENSLRLKQILELGKIGLGKWGIVSPERTPSPSLDRKRVWIKGAALVSHCLDAWTTAARYAVPLACSSI